MEDLGAAAKLRAIFELSPTILAVTDLADGRIIEVNEAFLRVLGYTREEIIGRRMPEMGLWKNPEVRTQGIAALRAGQPVRDLEAHFRTKSGGEIVAIAAADLVVVEGRTCILTSLMDITERVRGVTALRDSERRFAQVFRANPLPMTIVRRRDGLHLDVNDATLRHSGYTRDEMVGRTMAELGIHVVAEQRAWLREVLDTEGRARDFEVAFRTKAGEQRQLLVNSEVITYSGEDAVLNVSLDITERKQLEAEREARRLEVERESHAKDEFLAMLGHELRNPLGTITNTLGVLNRVLADEQTRRLTGIIGRQATHLTRLVDDLLDVARLTSGKIDLRLGTPDLRELAAQCLDSFTEAGRTVAHRIVVEGDAVWVKGDPARLEQVISNLLDNALKYTPAGGEVRVITAREGDDAVVRVEDTGEGIRADLLPKVFDLFAQEPQALDRARGGLGLGLTLVKRLVELHGGSVSATSAGRGRGSEFTVRLPAVAAPVHEDAVPPPPPASGTGRCRRVLIVEDNADARESLSLFLQLAGHEVATSEDGPRGLDTLPTFRPDVAVIDVGLPGMDGYEIARAIRRRPDGQRMCLIALTGYGQAEDQRRALAAGFDIHLTKPIDPAKIQDLLARG
jgi:PAS domain S-box-containing protein